MQSSSVLLLSCSVPPILFPLFWVGLKPLKNRSKPLGSNLFFPGIAELRLRLLCFFFHPFGRASGPEGPTSPIHLERPSHEWRY